MMTTTTTMMMKAMMMTTTTTTTTTVSSSSSFSVSMRTCPIHGQEQNQRDAFPRMLQYKKKITVQDLKVCRLLHRKKLMKYRPANVQLTLHQF
jgi:hypothetical protein